MKQSRFEQTPIGVENANEKQDIPQESDATTAYDEFDDNELMTVVQEELDDAGFNTSEMTVGTALLYREMHRIEERLATVVDHEIEQIDTAKDSEPLVEDGEADRHEEQEEEITDTEKSADKRDEIRERALASLFQKHPKVMTAFATALVTSGCTTMEMRDVLKTEIRHTVHATADRAYTTRDQEAIDQMEQRQLQKLAEDLQNGRISRITYERRKADLQRQYNKRREYTQERFETRKQERRERANKEHVLHGMRSIFRAIR